MVTNRSEADLAIQRRHAAIGSAVLMAVGPGTVAGLARTFGEQYERYCANVPGWVPRLRPWDGT
jgi:hypothetical protein